MTRAKMIVKALEKADENEKLAIIGTFYGKGIREGVELSLDDEADMDDKLSEELYQLMVRDYLKVEVGDNPSKQFDKVLLSMANR